MRQVYRVVIETDEHNIPMTENIKAAIETRRDTGGSAFLNAERVRSIRVTFDEDESDVSTASPLDVLARMLG